MTLSLEPVALDERARRVPRPGRARWPQARAIELRRRRRHSRRATCTPTASGSSRCCSTCSPTPSSTTGDGGTRRPSRCEHADGRVRGRVTDTGPGIPRRAARPALHAVRPPGRRRHRHRGHRPRPGPVQAAGRGDGRHASSVDSEVGEGSTFCVELPVGRRPGRRATTPSAAGRTPRRRAAGRAPPRSSTSRTTWRTCGWSSACSPRRPGVRARCPPCRAPSASSWPRQHRPDLILLDLHLPDLGGDVVLAAPAGRPGHGGHPRGHRLSADATTAPDPAPAPPLGADAYLTKPLDVSRLPRPARRAPGRARRGVNTGFIGLTYDSGSMGDLLHEERLLDRR